MNGTNNRWCFVVGCILALSTGEATFGQAEINVVSPSRFADVEGNGRSEAGRAGRLQALHPGSAFESVPASHRFITGLAWRPDVTNHFSGVVSGPVTFRLSTTTADSLTTVFANNLGEDATIVFDGDFRWQTDNDPSQGPRDFDYVVVFDEPFEYNGGNLVVDMLASRDASSTTGWFIDIERSGNGPPVTGVVGFAGSPSAYMSAQSIFPTQFTFSSGVLLGDLNLDGEVNGLDVDPFVEVLLSGPYQPEADMNSDQVVNGLDVDPFVAAVVGGGVQQIPEPSTLLLTLLALGLVGAWRTWRG